MFHKDSTPICGRMMMLESGLLLIPLLLLPFFPRELCYAPMFAIPAVISLLAGYLVCHFCREKRKINSSRIVVFGWFYGFFLAAIPFYLYEELDFVQSLFEAVSGFTTTGLSVMDVTKAPQLFLFYRSFLQYVGGLGFVMMMLLFVQGKFSVDLYQAEGHPDKLMPNIGKTVKIIVLMYSGLLVFGVVLYVICGMPVFDALLHSMCALSTGGFSNRLDSIGFYNSVPVELVTVLLMLIGTTNFSLLLLLFRGKVREFFKASEVRFLGIILLGAVPLMSLLLTQNYAPLQALRQAFFNAFSAISTTGYATCLYNDWPQTAVGCMVLLMLIGGGLGSTAGGMKLGRVFIVSKQLLMNVRRKMLPERTVMVSRYDRGNEKEVLTKDRQEEAWTYTSVYFLIFLIGTFVLSCSSGSTLLNSAFEFASSLGTVGLSIGITNPEASSLTLMIEIIGMVFGRLEIFVIFKALLRK